MILDQRVFHQDVDLSVEVNDFRTGAAPFAYQIGEYLYIASILPFNNLWFEIETPNAVLPAVVSPEIWWGGNQNWGAAVDILDGTKGLSTSGRIQWTTDVEKGWQWEYRSYDIVGLESTKIYNMYWMRFKWDKTLDPLTAIAYIGQLFSDDSILKSYYPDLLYPAVLNAFEAGKTNWREQHFMAADIIVRDLKKRNIIKARSQLLDYSLFVDAACHKVAEIVYTSFGQPYIEQLKLARAAYLEAINIKHFNVDLNANATLDDREREFSVSYGRR